MRRRPTWGLWLKHISLAKQPRSAHLAKKSCIVSTKFQHWNGRTAKQPNQSPKKIKPENATGRPLFCSFVFANDAKTVGSMKSIFLEMGSPERGVLVKTGGLHSVESTTSASTGCWREASTSWALIETIAGLLGLLAVSAWVSDPEGLAGFSGGPTGSGAASEACWRAEATASKEKPSLGVAPLALAAAEPCSWPLRRPRTRIRLPCPLVPSVLPPLVPATCVAHAPHAWH